MGASSIWSSILLESNVLFKRKSRSLDILFSIRSVSGESYALFHSLFTCSMSDFLSSFTSMDGSDVEVNSDFDFFKQLLIGGEGILETSGFD